jgi:hypothetical protein
VVSVCCWQPLLFSPQWLHLPQLCISCSAPYTLSFAPALSRPPSIKHQLSSVSQLGSCGHQVYLTQVHISVWRKGQSMMFWVPDFTAFSTAVKYIPFPSFQLNPAVLYRVTW